MTQNCTSLIKLYCWQEIFLFIHLLLGNVFEIQDHSRKHRHKNIGQICGFNFVRTLQFTSSPKFLNAFLFETSFIIDAHCLTFHFNAFSYPAYSFKLANSLKYNKTSKPNSWNLFREVGWFHVIHQISFWSGSWNKDGVSKQGNIWVMVGFDTKYI